MTTGEARGEEDRSDERDRRAKVAALHLRELHIHEEAAGLHKRAADFFELAAMSDRQHGWRGMADRMEELADVEREAAASQDERADRARADVERDRGRGSRRG
jgi:hypothetical protein